MHLTHCASYEDGTIYFRLMCTPYLHHHMLQRELQKLQSQKLDSNMPLQNRKYVKQSRPINLMGVSSLNFPNSQLVYTYVADPLHYTASINKVRVLLSLQLYGDEMSYVKRCIFEWRDCYNICTDLLRSESSFLA